MSFHHPKREGNDSFGYYILTVVIAAVTYILGSVPMGLVYFSTGELGDPIEVVEKHYGLNTTFVLLVLPLVLSFFAVLASVKWVHRFPVLSVFTTRKRFDFKRMFIAFGLWFAFSIVLFFVEWNDNIQWNFEPTKFLGLLFVACLLLPFQCAVEELLFRGVLLQWMGKRMRPLWAIAVVTGVLFGLMHSANPEVIAIGYTVMIYYIFTGIFLGIIALLDDGLELTIGYHIANNLFVAVFVTNHWQAFQTDALFLDTNPPSFTIRTMAYLVAAQGVFFVICMQLFNWKQGIKKLWAVDGKP